MATPRKKAGSKPIKRPLTKGRASKRKSAAPKWQTRYKDVTFCFTGEPQRGGQAEYTKFVEAAGGKVAKTVSAQVDYLIVCQTKAKGPSTAEKKAKQLNQKSGASIQILDESDFFPMFIPDRDLAIAMLKGGPEGIEAWNRVFPERTSVYPSIDLSGTSFQGCELANANLYGANVDDCNFRRANLEGVRFKEVSRAKFDGATGQFAIGTATDCSLKDCSLTDESDCIQFSNCDLTKCTIGPVHASYDLSFWHTEAIDCCFDGADLQMLDLNASRFVGSSFRKTNLKECTLTEADFTNCDLTGANLALAEMSRAILKSANLTRTDFQDANLVDADLSNATINGANFTNAHIAGVDLSTLDTAKAKGLDEASANIQLGQAGVKVQELEQTARAAKQISSSIVIKTPKEEFTARFRASGPTYLFYSVWGEKRRSVLHNYHASFSHALIDIAKQVPNGELQVDTVTVKGTKAPVKGKDLKMLCLAAWCEVFGREMPTDQEIKQAANAKREGEQELNQEMLAELRGGAKGVKLWNERSKQDREQAGHFRKVDLKKGKLSKVHLQGMDFQQADFTGANLKKAALSGADFKKAVFANVDAAGASFMGAKLHDADFRGANLTKGSLGVAYMLRTNFEGADLTKATLSYGDISGADFTNANLTDVKLEATTFDENTVFPKGFKPPEELKWGGQGHDPRVAEKIKQVTATGPIDFDAFMEQLEANFDASRLKKAMSMLKADSFQLFADVQSDSMTGVVKSQTDADLVYSCRLDAEGTFACCTQNLNPCGGLRGALCKHLLVLIVGLTKGEELDPTTVNGWVAASKLQKPNLDKDLMSEVFLKYKGAEAGEIDWRPTETVPEDYYAF